MEYILLLHLLYGLPYPFVKFLSLLKVIPKFYSNFMKLGRETLSVKIMISALPSALVTICPLKSHIRDQNH